jgi:hypothetical protein
MNEATAQQLADDNEEVRKQRNAVDGLIQQTLDSIADKMQSRLPAWRRWCRGTRH